MDEGYIKNIVQMAVQRRRHVLVYHIARRLFDVVSIDERSDNEEAAEGLEWHKIASLSQLRSLVGGRFSNLKQKWVASGFPLREHRGDREGTAELNYNEWVFAF